MTCSSEQRNTVGTSADLIFLAVILNSAESVDEEKRVSAES